MGPCEVEGDGPGKVERRSSWSGERLYRVKSPPPGLVSDEQGRASDIKTYSSYTSSYTWKKYFYHWVKYLGGEPEGANIPSVWGNHIKIPGGSCPSVGQRISSWSIRHMKVLEPLFLFSFHQLYWIMIYGKHSTCIYHIWFEGIWLFALVMSCPKLDVLCLLNYFKSGWCYVSGDFWII